MNKSKETMEQINRIELRGNVGSVKLQNFENRKMARISLATNFAYKDKLGSAVIETTWHNLIAWEGKNVSDLDKIKVGTMLQASGRMRFQRYKTAEGEEKELPEVLVSKLSIINDDEGLSCEM